MHAWKITQAVDCIQLKIMGNVALCHYVVHLVVLRRLKKTTRVCAVFPCLLGFIYLWLRLCVD